MGLQLYTVETKWNSDLHTLLHRNYISFNFIVLSVNREFVTNLVYIRLKKIRRLKSLFLLNYQDARDVFLTRPTQRRQSVTDYRTYRLTMTRFNISLPVNIEHQIIICKNKTRKMEVSTKRQKCRKKENLL